MQKTLTARVGADGVLTLSVPLGKQDANKTVRVTVETVDEATGVTRPGDREAWLQFIAETGGSITDPTFERQPQGEYEHRDSLP
jgi:hypothetical protein